MDYTDEYTLGWGAWAQRLGFETKHYDKDTFYELPSKKEISWVHEVHPTEGLFAASAWFTPEQTLDYTAHIQAPCLLVLCIDCGAITFTRQGKAAQTLTPTTHLIINPQKPFRITFPAGIHTCFTSVLVFDSCIAAFLAANGIAYPIRVADAGQWTPAHVDTPNVMLVMEQIRWGVRGNRLPPPAYLCKAMELLCQIAHNRHLAQHRRARRHYVTWENEQKLYLVKDSIDRSPLAMPTTEALCMLAQMSESKLRLAFKSLYGTTLYAYMRKAVMQRAMQLLAYDELSIKNIAGQCGYENPAKFTAAFKDVHGITPSAFRKGFEL